MSEKSQVCSSFSQTKITNFLIKITEFMMKIVAEDESIGRGIRLISTFGFF